MLLTSLLRVAPAHAAFPGTNGKIAFQNWPGTYGDLYTINPDGTGSALLVRASSVGAGNKSLEFPAWSADGARLFFDNQDGIWSINANGSGLREIVGGSGTYTHPSPSPDGSQVAFAYTATGATGPSVQLSNVEGGGRRTLVAAEPTRSYSSPTWSPIGTSVAMTAADTSGAFGVAPHSVAIAAADGSSLKVFNREYDDTTPDWAPDGHGLAFLEASPGRTDLYRMTLNGLFIASVVRLTSAPAESFGAPAYSPDGREILVVGQTSGEISVVSATDGSGMRRLTSTGGWADMPNWAAAQPSTTPTDTTPPVTTAVLSPAPTADGWNGGPVTVTLNSTDPDGVADVASIHYLTSAGATGTVIGNVATIVISAPGVTGLSFYAIDRAGNREGTKSIRVAIDVTAPVTTATAFPGGLIFPWLPPVQIDAQGSVNGGPTFSVSCFDTRGVNVSLSAVDTQAGVDHISYTLTGAQTGSANIPGALTMVGISTVGTTQVSYHAVDKVGNVETPAKVVLVSVMPGGLPISCMSTPITAGALPPHGIGTITGTLNVGGVSYPFSVKFSY